MKNEDTVHSTSAFKPDDGISLYIVKNWKEFSPNSTILY